MMAEVVHSGHVGSHSDGVMEVGRGLLSRGDGVQSCLILSCYGGVCLAPWEQEEGRQHMWMEGFSRLKRELSGIGYKGERKRGVIENSLEVITKERQPLFTS